MISLKLNSFIANILILYCAYDKAVPTASLLFSRGIPIVNVEWYKINNVTFYD